MDEELVKRWNARVKPNDKVYVLGDVVMRRPNLDIMGRLTGDKILIKGNHDIFKMKEYALYFRDIRAYHVMNGCILSHIPIHEESLGRFGCNIHGHTHYREVTKTDERGQRIPDERYLCVSVEHIDYTPILFEDACKKIVTRGGAVGFRERGEAAL